MSNFAEDLADGRCYIMLIKVRQPIIYLTQIASININSIFLLLCDKCERVRR